MTLLDVAELDSQIGRLRHQLASLPQIAEIEELRARQGRLTDQARDARVAVDDLTREQKRADADVEQVRARRERDRSRMDQGLITNPKDLERMTHELTSLERRISTLEDAELEVMQQLEDAQRRRDEVGTELDAVEQRLGEAGQERDIEAGKLTEELERVTADREAAVTGLPEDLLALYDRIREKQGVGAAALRARRCGGCQLTLNAADLAQIAKAPDDQVVRCEECGRILVRTPESGV